MTFEEWWDRPEGCGATPDTYKGWEQSCHVAWNAGATSRDAEVAELKGMVNEIQAARHVQREHNDLLVNNHELREQVAELQGQVGLLLRIAKALAATEPK